MKKYFAKYLPVEGEIKEGDFYSCPHKGHALQIEGLPLAHQPKMIVCKNEVGGGVICPDCYKIKLFLCSRDIQVGDTYFVDDFGPIEYICNELTTLSEDFVTTYEPYKVIGEISPEATWVKEGDEFDASELLQQGTGINLTANGGKIKVMCPLCKKYTH